MAGAILLGRHRSKGTSQCWRQLLSPLADPAWTAVEIIIDEAVVRDLIPSLKELGAEGIIEYPLNKVVY